MPVEDIQFRPTTTSYLNALFQQVFVPLKFGQSVSITTFAGAGKWANIRFIIDQMPSFDPTYPQTAYLYLNAKDLAFSALEEVKNGITFMLSKAIIQKNTLAQAFAEKNISYNDPLSFAQSFLRLVREYNQRLVVIVDDSEALFVHDRLASNAITFLQTLVNIEVTKISFLFLTKGEVSNSSEDLRYLHKFYAQHPITEAQIPFDKQCVEESLNLFEQKNGVSLTPAARLNIKTITESDPLMVKFLFMEYASNLAVKELLDLNPAQCNIAKLYSTMNTTYCDERYNQLIALISPQSRDYLYGLGTEPTPYLLEANLVSKGGTVQSQLFAYYLKERSSRFDLGADTIALTPREERVFKLLLDSLGKVVSREDIAKSLWGESWQSQFSEESIDKVVSSIRNKLSDTTNRISYDIKSAKGLGIIVERRR